MQDGKLRVAVAGLGFGSDFVPVYARHPDVGAVDLVEPDPARLDPWRGRPGVGRLWTSLEEALRDPGLDAVHLATPIPLHAGQAVQVLRSGRHCACAVPAATTLEELRDLVDAERESGRVYMMMETAVYTRPFLEVRRRHEAGEFGRLQLLRGFHYQDLENHPPYWRGFPPMGYSTHAVAPLLVLAGRPARRVHCLGSGSMREWLREGYGNPWPAETALFRLDGHPAALEVTRTLFETARAACEGFCVYGSDMAAEWHFDDQPLRLQRRGPPRPGVRGCPHGVEDVEAPDFAHRLPPGVAGFTRPRPRDGGGPPEGGGHHGSHPHLVHEFVRSMVEGRPSAIPASAAAAWTAAGLCAHASALRGGEGVDIPGYGWPPPAAAPAPEGTP